jgi:hypothetical protein
MRRQNLLLSIILGLPLAFAACGGGSNTNVAASATPAPAATPQAATTPVPTRQEVTATVEEAKLDAGGAGEATVRLDIADGYHTHANPATDRFYIATELSAEPLEGVTPGKPVYPPGVQRKLGFTEKPLSLYEGTVRIRLPLRADKDAPKGRHTLRARLRVQPCNDEACLPPRYIEAPIPVTVN